MIIIPIKWLFHWEYTPFSDKPIEFNIKSSESCCGEQAEVRSPHQILGVRSPIRLTQQPTIIDASIVVTKTYINLLVYFSDLLLVHSI